MDITNELAINYDSSANTDDGTCYSFLGVWIRKHVIMIQQPLMIIRCTYAVTYYDCDDNCLVDTDGDGVCDELEVLYCTDLTAFNYDTSVNLKMMVHV